MLPADLLQYTLHFGQAYPRFLKPERGLPWAEQVLETLSAHRGRTRGELDEALLSLEGDSPDYRVVRGLAHLALAEATLEVQSPVAPEALRREAFALATQRGYGERETGAVLGELAQKYELEAETLREVLYADLPEREVLTTLPELTPAALLERYQLAQAQGLLYYATELLLQAHRNTSGEYKKLFRFLKFYGLMYVVEGDLDTGYRIHVDGPASLFAQTRRYGVRMATFLPALLHVTKWELEARLYLRGQETRYALTSEARLVSHYSRPPEFDSLLEEAFFKRWARLETLWALEREVEVIDLKGTVFLPDFALRHLDGRTVYVEIVGFWRPDYLKRKLEKVRRAGLPNLILAVSERLKVGEGDLEDLPGPVVFFKGKLDPGKVLDVTEGLGTG
jgi:predicted nuclease of restriction endonuclease-like RecB superfamily